MRGFPVKTVLVAAAFALFGSAASAATFDFATLANAGEGIWSTNLNPSIVAGGWTQDGITVFPSATGGADAYLDAGFGSPLKPAGLGVCKIWDAAGQCTPSSDDNVQTGETLILSFSTKVQIDQIVLRDAEHVLFVLNDTINFVGQNASGLYTVGLGNPFLTFGQGTLWSFNIGGRSPKDFYIASITVSAVPLPAGGLLLLTALGGIAAVRRRKTRAA